MLSSKHVLQAPDFHKQFSLMVDVSQMGAGAALMQVDEKGIKHLVSYFRVTSDELFYNRKRGLSIATSSPTL